MSNGALLSLVATGAMNAYLPKDFSSHTWDNIEGSMINGDNNKTMYEYHINRTADMIDTATSYLTLVCDETVQEKNLLVANVIDRVSLGVKSDPSNVFSIAMFDGFAIPDTTAMLSDAKAAVTILGKRIHVKLQLTSCSIPGAELILRVRYKIPLQSSYLGIRHIFHNIMHKDLKWDVPYLTNGSCEKVISTDNKTGLRSNSVCLPLNMVRFQAPVTDIRFRLKDSRGHVLKCIDQVDLTLNTHLLFSGDQYLCCHHIPDRLYGSNAPILGDTYHISFAEDPVSQPGKGTVNFSRIENCKLRLTFADATPKGPLTLQMVWRYHNVVRRNLVEGAGILLNCSNNIYSFKPIIRTSVAAHAELTAQVPVPRSNGNKLSYAVYADLLDNAALFTVLTDSGGVAQIVRDSQDDDYPDVNLAINDSLILMTSNKSVRTYKVDIRAFPTCQSESKREAAEESELPHKRTRIAEML